jgi:phosphohistidine phosphatase
MKTLVLLRHGKSSWESPALRDFDRPLTPRGRGAAELMGEELRRRGLRFDLVLASPARRAADTLQLFEGAFGESLNIRFDEDVYAASWPTLLKIIQRTDRKVGSLLIVGHNPGLQNLAVELAGEDKAGMGSHFPTATAVTLTLAVKSWKDVQPGTGTIDLFLKPKEILARRAA